MSEKDMRSRVVSWLKNLDAMSVENPAHIGTPDVECIAGWIELKQLKGWPKRESTVVRLEHFTPQQRIWLDRRCRAGGKAWLLLQVRREWALFTGDVAAKVVGKSTKEQLKSSAAFWWTSSADIEEELSCFLQKT